VATRTDGSGSTGDEGPAIYICFTHRRCQGAHHRRALTEQQGPKQARRSGGSCSLAPGSCFGHVGGRPAFRRRDDITLLRQRSADQCCEEEMGFTLRGNGTRLNNTIVALRGTGSLPAKGWRAAAATQSAEYSTSWLGRVGGNRRRIWQTATGGRNTRL
jgi:hypothetical protein